MSWIKDLYDTYESSIKNPEFSLGEKPLLPINHTLKQAHVEIYLDKDGQFLKNRAKVIPKLETIIPATEKSSTRTTNNEPHPLCDKVQYCAKDYAAYGGLKKPYFQSYLNQIETWCKSDFSHPAIEAVYNYVKKGTLVADLIGEKILHVGEDGKLLSEWKSELPKPEIFKYITQDQGDAFIRWVVEIPGMLQSECWTDITLYEAWNGFVTSKDSIKGLCMQSGNESSLATKHPARLRHSADGAKLISSNDLGGYTFLGRFLNANEAAGVSSETTQKAHSALRWLIGRKQAFRNGDQVIVSWAVTGESVPEILLNTFDLFADENETTETPLPIISDIGQAFSQHLKKYIAGYSVKLGETNKIVILGLDSASPGRLAITFYRELTGSEFLGRIEKWHSDLAWKQRISIEDDTGKKKGMKTIWPVCAPAPKDIAQASYGLRIDEKLKKATVERLLPCIVDNLPLPIDLVDSTVRRACNRVNFKKQWEWEVVLGIACSLYKGYYLRNPNGKRSYSMALEPECKNRDYLFGRLLAAADGLEKYALDFEKTGPKEDTRQTNAARFMQQFAIKPCSTWKNIYLALQPYIAKLGNRAGKYCRTITEVTDSFLHDDFVSPKPLSGEFLLGYHCQRQAFFDNNKKTNETELTNL
jgi:CRISPR-associated protein Csd1